MHEVKRITIIKNKQLLPSLGDFFTGMRYRTVQWAQTLVSRVTGLRSPPFPLLPIFPQSCSIAIHTPFCPLSCTSPQDSTDRCACLTAQSHKRGIEMQMAVGGTTPLNRLYCSCQHLIRLYFTTQEEQHSKPGEARPTWATLRRAYSVIFIAISQNRELWCGSLPSKYKTPPIKLFFCKISNWIPPSFQHSFLHTEVIIV